MLNFGNVYTQGADEIMQNTLIIDSHYDLQIFIENNCTGNPQILPEVFHRFDSLSDEGVPLSANARTSSNNSNNDDSNINPYLSFEGLDDSQSNSSQKMLQITEQFSKN